MNTQHVDIQTPNIAHIGAEIEPNVKSNGEGLCVSCSMCCQGALFGKLHVTPDERTRLGEDVDYFMEGDQLCLRLGCQHIGANGACQRYEFRPKGCGDYVCKQLRTIDAGETTHDDAMALVVKAKQMNARCVELAHLALTDEFWDAEHTTTAIRSMFRVQYVAQMGLPIAKDILKELEAAWYAYADFVSTHFVENVTREEFRTHVILPSGIFDHTPA